MQPGGCRAVLQCSINQYLSDAWTLPLLQQSVAAMGGRVSGYILAVLHACKAAVLVCVSQLYGPRALLTVLIVCWCDYTNIVFLNSATYIALLWNS